MIQHRSKLLLLALCGSMFSLCVVAEARAQAGEEIRCRGGADLFVIDRLDAETLSLNFSSSKRAAGANSIGLEPGTCSWIERTAKDDEPRQIQFRVTEAEAISIPYYLKDEDNYWRFFVVNSDRGFYKAKNHKAWKKEQEKHHK